MERMLGMQFGDVLELSTCWWTVLHRVVVIVGHDWSVAFVVAVCEIKDGHSAPERTAAWSVPDAWAVAHSAVSVTAYKALAARVDGPPVALLTRGSPLGLRSIILGGSIPAPRRGDRLRGVWPAGVQASTNSSGMARGLCLLF